MAKTSSLVRLTRLYGRIENLHALHVKSAANALGEAEQALRSLMANQLDQANLGRKGLADGNRVESLAGLHTAEADAQRGELLALLGSERRRALDAARQAHRVCRIEFAQMEEMVERTRREAEALEARRAQSVSDDRFLARKHWTEQREPRPR